MREVELNEPVVQRRRSQRISESVPLVIHGADLLGQPFDERTATLSFNLHGCRYTSKHHLPRNTWVTLEAPESSSKRSVRARVAWVQRPHSIRDFFQIAVELESPCNVWGVDSPPPDWAPGTTFSSPAEGSASERERSLQQSNSGLQPATLSAFMENLAPVTTSSSQSSQADIAVPDLPEAPAAPSPLLHELAVRLERDARTMLETATAEACDQVRHTASQIEQAHAAMNQGFIEGWRSEFEWARNHAREELGLHFTAQQQEFLAKWHEELQQYAKQARELVAALEGNAQKLRVEGSAAQEAASRLAQSRLQLEAAEAARTSAPAVTANSPTEAAETVSFEEWRQRLKSEMSVAEGEWNELLQTSLDGGMRRVVQQLSERAQEMLRNEEKRLGERFAEIQQPFAQTTMEAREALLGMRSALEREVGHARSSLAEIEHSAGRMKEFSAQLEAASQDTINQLHGRIDQVVEWQTGELNRRAENLAGGLAQRATPALEALGEQFLVRAVSQLESRLAPHLDRVPELLRELTAREEQIEDSLRLHRERLRQTSERSHREAASTMNETLADLRSEFESARKDALAKWTEELDASGVRSSHAAAEAIEHSSEWFQQEARARLQALVEQSVSSAGKGFEEQSAEAASNFQARLIEKSGIEFDRLHDKLENAASEIMGMSHTQIERSAELAASSFGEVLHVISEKEIGQFRDSGGAALEECSSELVNSSRRVLAEAERSAQELLKEFQAQMAEQLDRNIAEGSRELAAEFASALETCRSERASHQQQWAESLAILSADATANYQEQLHTATDAWVLSSIRRLNEQGQKTTESLVRSADQSLRDSFSRVFEGLTEALREQTGAAAGVAGFASQKSLDMAEPPSPRNRVSPT